MVQKVVVKDYRARRLISGYAAPLVFLFFSTLFSLPFIMEYMIDQGVSSTLDPDEVTRAILIPALIATFLAEGAAIVVGILFAGDRKRYRDVLGLNNFSPKTVGLGAGVGVAFLAGLLAIEALASSLGAEIGNSDTVNQFSELSGLELIFVLFVCVSILAPLFEELFFRGLMLGHLMEGHEAKGLSLTAPIVLSSVLYTSVWFSSAHFQGAGSLIDFTVLAWPFLFAVAAAFLRLKTNSLYPSIAAHMVYNFISALLIFLA